MSCRTVCQWHAGEICAFLRIIVSPDFSSYITFSSCSHALQRRAHLHDAKGINCGLHLEDPQDGPPRREYKGGGMRPKTLSPLSNRWRGVGEEATFAFVKRNYISVNVIDALPYIRFLLIVASSTRKQGRATLLFPAPFDGEGGFSARSRKGNAASPVFNVTS